MPSLPLSEPLQDVKATQIIRAAKRIIKVLFMTVLLLCFLLLYHVLGRIARVILTSRGEYVIIPLEVKKCIKSE
jgi:hypothetical protein